MKYKILRTQPKITANERILPNNETGLMFCFLKTTIMFSSHPKPDSSGEKDRFINRFLANDSGTTALTIVVEYDSSFANLKEQYNQYAAENEETMSQIDWNIYS